MKDNDIHIPEEFFEWLEHSDYESLNNQQQKQVATIFTALEYNNMRKTILALREVEQQKEDAIEVVVPENLWKAFDTKYPKTDVVQTKTVSIGLWIWRAAAILFFICSSVVLSLYLKQKSNSEMTQISIRDTVYLVKHMMSAPTVLYDTVFRDLQLASRPTKEKQISNDLDLPIVHLSSTTDMRILSVDEADATANAQKKNSLKHDTLTRQFAFVSF